MKRMILSIALFILPACAYAQDFPTDILPENLWDDESIMQRISRTDLENALADKAAAQQLMIHLRSDPYYDRRDITVRVGIQEVTYIFDPGARIDSMGPKETLSPSQWAMDVGAIVKGATSGMAGQAKIKVNVTRKDGKGGETTVNVEVEVSGKK